MFAAVAVVGITSCSESAIDENLDTNQPSVEQNNGEGSYLFASIDNGSATRVSMTDDGVLSFAWEAGDVITINVAGTDYTYTCEDASTGKFTCDDAPAFVDGDKYTASFGATTPATSQDNTDNKFANSESLRLEASFTYTEGEDITLTFEGTHPIITITKTVGSSYGDSCTVGFYDGGNFYEAKGVITGEVLKANIVINASNGERNLSFMLSGADGELKEIYETSTSKEYKAGVRYNANLGVLATSDPDSKLPVFSTENIDANRNGECENSEIKNYLENLTYNQKHGGTWFIPGTTVPAGLKAYLVKNPGDYTDISIICLDMQTINAREFAGCHSLTSISCPNVTTIEDFAFQYCANLATIYFPKAITIGAAAFKACKNLTEAWLIAPTTITLETDALATSRNKKCDLYLSPVNYADVVGKSWWNGCNWKSITKVE